MMEAGKDVTAGHPRCLAGFVVEPAALPDYPFDGHVTQRNVLYGLACRCGGEGHAGSRLHLGPKSL